MGNGISTPALAHGAKTQLLRRPDLALNTAGLLRGLAESTEDPRTAALLFLALRGGNCGKNDLQAFLKLKGRVDRLDAYLNALRNPIDGNAIAIESPVSRQPEAGDARPLQVDRIVLLPAASWKLIRRRQFAFDQAPPLPFEQGLAAARAAVDGASVESRVESRASRAASPPMAAVQPPMAAAQLPVVSSSPQLATGNCQLAIAEAQRGTNGQLDAATILERLRTDPTTGERCKPDIYDWPNFLGWWLTVLRKNPERIERAWQAAQAHQAANVPRFMYKQIQGMRSGLG